MNTTKTITELDAQLNEAIISGNALEAFEAFYHDDVVMQENDADPTIGKSANRKREQAFFAAITEFRSGKVLATGIGGDTSFSHWHYDFTHTEWGRRNYHQIAIRTWRDGKIIREIFYYG
jgi:hypothetical protein